MTELTHVMKIFTLTMMIVGFVDCKNHPPPLKCSSNQRELKFTTKLNETLYMPTNVNFSKKFKGWHGFSGNATYLRNEDQILKRGEHGRCESALGVLAWLMDKVNSKKGMLMLTYGELIHFYREKEFVKDGKYMDDDIDMWASPETLLHVLRMERQLFKFYGWTIRAIFQPDDDRNYAALLQIVDTCGHKPSKYFYGRNRKVHAVEPGIEIYPFSIIGYNDNGDDCVFKDLWNAKQFPAHWINPPQFIAFTSNGTSMPLQLPRKPSNILECEYGNWKVPSGSHGNSGPCSNID